MGATQPRELRDAVEAALLEQAGAARYRHARMGARPRTEGARPLEFDESGFPIPQRNPGLVQRIGRLLSPF
jgi:hypothetical protein